MSILGSRPGPILDRWGPPFHHRGAGGAGATAAGPPPPPPTPAAPAPPRAVGGPGLVDVPTDRRRADKLDGVHTGVHQQRVDRLTPTVHNVEHAIGEASFLP